MSGAGNAGKFSRRQALGRAGWMAAGAVALAQSPAEALASAQRAAGAPEAPFRYCLNTATIRGQKLGIVKEIEVAAQAGYEAIEPWVDSIGSYVNNGGSLADLNKRIRDKGLTVEDAIGFSEWIVEDDARRAKAFERIKREMEMVVQIGGKRLAAPPSGATDWPKLDWIKASQRYRQLLEAGEQIGLTPQLELWGFSKNLSRLGECVCVAMETGHRNACVLVDVFHLYKGGSDFHGMGLLGPSAVQVLHMNDYPGDVPRETIDDSFRVYPGDGAAPLGGILQTFHKTGGQKVLSLELFNRTYWSQDPLAVAQLGLAKMKEAVSKAGL
jgi:sugar phosphate isomerase/epimerase